MLFTNTCVIILLLVKFVETNSVSNIRCSTNGDVYIRTGEQLSDVKSDNLSLLFASSSDRTCDHQETGNVVKIFGCLQPYRTSVLDVFLRNGTQRLLMIRIYCSSAERSWDAIGYSTDNVFIDRHRRQNVLTDEDVRKMETSVIFTVGLNFSSNDEIDIECNPNGLGILYLSNPDPALYKNILSFSELTKKRCNAQFVSERKFVAVGGCSLDFPITVSFSIHLVHASVIGGASRNFKLYNITCTDPAVRKTYFEVFDYKNAAAGNDVEWIWVAFMTITWTAFCEVIFF
ncbi:uncharacterized protein LOC123541133 [Mercenaria mercenaria]|uniref:uncharacterized protein LOC123541133 n=1 Tax=Mercenaria mercenaria TaxID=6596 RepID=UPI00234EDAE7|nr:uncharacterized protein LOC123541133 [Mercenaria mercenaria]